ncbi:trypsin-like peptidase domain-containing protein [Pseudomonas sp.]|uniref:trypsin-like peptidase domain-containing protein n=1 Tax=Pseudomonas sp. TaxID=306 RepID=UPI0028A8BED3|nr:trypsin-like peptidase domain-containing protein [Pseudomonas sp.]
MLTPGANTAIGSSSTAWTLTSPVADAFGSTAGVALLPVNERRAPTGPAALFHVEQCAWMSWSGDPAQVGCALRLDHLPEGSDRVLLLVYRYANLGPVSALGSLTLRIDQTIHYTLDVSGQGESALILGEFYQRAGQWKFRALAEGSAYGLAAFGRRLGVELDENHPERPAGRGGAPDTSAAYATGTGFAVSGNTLLTCAHVIEGMQAIEIHAFSGRHRAEPIMVDTTNDIALLRVDAVVLQPVQVAASGGCALGDPVTAVGFPLAGFAGGGAHVTQGGISALFGLRNDATLLQFTAAIQPGSSGSPLFDGSGAVIGMVTSTVADAQNMNFAVKAQVLAAFLEACHVPVSLAQPGALKSPAEIARAAQPSLWKIEARR